MKNRGAITLKGRNVFVLRPLLRPYQIIVFIILFTN